MRLQTVLVAFVAVTFFCVDQTESQFLSALTTGIDTVIKAAGLIGKFVPSSLALPLAIAAPVKLSLPFLFGLKALGLIKLKLLAPKVLLAAPLVAAKGAHLAKKGALIAPIVAAPIAIVKAGATLAAKKVALVKKGSLALLHLPGKLAAGALGAIVGAKAGAKAGVVSYKAHTKKKLLAPIFIPAAALLGPHGASLLPALLPGLGGLTGAPGFRALSLPAGLGSASLDPHLRAATFSSAPAFTGSNAPTLDGISTQINLNQLLSGGLLGGLTSGSSGAAFASRRRRDVSEEQPEVTVEALREIFAYIRKHDKERCVPRVICELAVQPLLAGNQGEDVTQLMMNLDGSDASAPWIEYRDAAHLGHSSKNRRNCYQRYPTCTQATETLLQLASDRLDGKTEN